MGMQHCRFHQYVKGRAFGHFYINAPHSFIQTGRPWWRKPWYVLNIKIKIRFYCHAYTQKLSSAFNPSRLAPVDMHRVAHSWSKMTCTGWVSSHSQHLGNLGIRSLAQGHLGCGKEVDCHPSSCQSHQSFKMMCQKWDICLIKEIDQYLQNAWSDQQRLYFLV